MITIPHLSTRPSPNENIAMLFILFIALVTLLLTVFANTVEQGNLQQFLKALEGQSWVMQPSQQLC